MANSRPGGLFDMQNGMAGLGAYSDLLKEFLSPDVNTAIIASKNLLAVAESTQVKNFTPSLQAFVGRFAIRTFKSGFGTCVINL